MTDAVAEARIALTVNGHAVDAAVQPRQHLADFLREQLLLTGTHLGCEQGVCGACTVLVDGRPTRSCVTLAIACDAADVRTIEGFEDDPLMARLREAFSRHHALQCGFCTPGMLATAYDVARRLPGADAERVRRELSGNLCRCTGYAGAVAAIEDVISSGPPPASVQPAARARPRPAPQNAGSPPAQVAPRDARDGAQGGARSGPQDGAAAAGDLAPPAEVTDGVALERRLVIDAPPDAVWRVLEDLPAVVACIPGASLTAPFDGGRAQGRVAVALGVIRATFDGVGDVRFEPAARRGSVLGRGRDRLSRSTLDGALDFALAPAENEASRLTLSMRYRLRGPLAQFGRPEVVAALADKILADTAARLAARAAGAPIADAPPALNGFALLWEMMRGVLRRRGGS